MKSEVMEEVPTPKRAVVHPEGSLHLLGGRGPIGSGRVWSRTSDS
jgi:hypothetical protein